MDIVRFHYESAVLSNCDRIRKIFVKMLKRTTCLILMFVNVQYNTSDLRAYSALKPISKRMTNMNTS